MPERKNVCNRLKKISPLTTNLGLLHISACPIYNQGGCFEALRTAKTTLQEAGNFLRTVPSQELAVEAVSRQLTAVIVPQCLSFQQTVYLASQIVTTMPKFPVLNLHNWIEENRQSLKPPIGNKVMYPLTEDFIVMVVGGPNQRTDYHYNETEEFFYMVEGDMLLKIQEDGKAVDVPIREGEIFLLPARTLHSPRRPAGSIGIVIERVRNSNHTDGLIWFCEKCNHKLYEEYFPMENIMTQMQGVFEKVYASEELRSCGSCGHVLQPPGKA